MAEVTFHARDLTGRISLILERAYDPDHIVWVWWYWLDGTWTRHRSEVTGG